MLRLPLFPNFISITRSRDFCLRNRLLPYGSLNYSVWFCLLFKITSISVSETTIKNCFHGSFAEVPWAAFFSNWTRLVLFLEGMTGCGPWCHRGRGKKRGGRERSWRGWEPQSKPADPTRLLSAPQRAVHSQTGTVFWERLFKQSQEIIYAKALTSE